MSHNHPIAALSLYLKPLLLVLVTLTSATWLLGWSNFKYQLEQNLRFNSGISGENESWAFDGVLSNFSSAGSALVYARKLPGRSEALSVTVVPKNYSRQSRYRIRARWKYSQTQFERSPQHLNNAVLLARFLDHNKLKILTKRLQAFDEAASGWNKEYILRIPANTRYLRIAFLNRESDDRIELTHIVIDIVQLNSLYQVLTGVLVFLWLSLLMGILLWTIKRINLSSSLLITGTIMAISIGMLLPKRLIKSLLQFTGITAQETTMVLYNSGHYLLFTLLTVFTIRLFREEQVSQYHGALVLCIVAIATEGFQTHFPGRNANFYDFLLDLAGILTGLIICCIYPLLRRYPRGSQGS